jgi:hypothetical protein
VRSQRLTAWAMARPCLSVCNSIYFNLHSGFHKHRSTHVTFNLISIFNGFSTTITEL